MGIAQRLFCGSTVVLLVWMAMSCQAASGQSNLRRVHSDRLLSDSVVFHVSARDVNQLREAFHGTEYGQLLNEEQLKPFFRDLHAQIQEKFAPQIERLGVRWEDLEGIDAGELAYATLLVSGPTETDPKTKAASLFMADVHADQQAALELLEKITANLLEQGARKQDAMEILDVEVEHYQLKRQAGEINVPRVYIAHTGGWLFASDQTVGLEQVLTALAAGSAETPLAEHPGYAAVRNRLDLTGDFGAADLSWFTDPFPLARVIADQQLEPGQAADYAKAMESTGFDAIRGIGGDVSFGRDDTEVFFQTFIAVPGTGELATRLQQSARTLTFPKSSSLRDLAPPPWIRDTAASSLSWLWDSGSAFNAFEPLVDSLHGEGTFRSVVDGIRKDENTQVDLPALAAALGPRWHFATEVVEPLTGESEKMVLVIEMNQPDVAVPNLRNYLQADWYRSRQVSVGDREVELWEFQGEPDTTGNDPIEILLNPENESAGEEGEEENLFLGMSSFAILPGTDYLLGANDSEYLLEVLESGEGISGRSEYQRVAAKLMGYHQTAPSFYRFVFPDRVHELSYELLRTGQLPSTEVTLERLLRAVLQVEKGVIRKQEIDPAKMPDDYQGIVAPHLGPAGWMLWVEAEGWYLAGVGLSKP